MHVLYKTKVGTDLVNTGSLRAASLRRSCSGWMSSAGNFTPSYHLEVSVVISDHSEGLGAMHDAGTIDTQMCLAHVPNST
jgi:hypothetical protein